MKKVAFAAVVLSTLVAAPLSVRAEDAKLPFNPFEKAQKGDWCVLTGTFKRDGVQEQKMSCASFARITRVEGDQVVLSDQVQVGAIEKASKTFSAKEAPTVAAYFDLKDGTVEGLKVEDDKRKVCDKELACKKLTFTWKHEHSADEFTAWISPDVKAGGLVAFVMKGHLKAKVDLETHIKMECAGCGNGDKKDMGEAPDDLLDAEMLGDAEESALELPFKLFQNAKKGDWAALRMEANLGGQNEVGTINFEVAKVKKDSVELEATMSRGGRGAQEPRTFTIDTSKPMGALEFLSMLVKGREPNKENKPAISNVKVTDEKKTVGDREFACKKLSFVFKEHGQSIRVKMWVSPDAKGIGLVAAEVKAKEKGGEVAIEMELGGFGDDDKTEWGKTAEQLSKKSKKKKADDDE